MYKSIIGLDLSLVQSGSAEWREEWGEVTVSEICPPFTRHKTLVDPDFSLKRLKHILSWVRSKVSANNNPLVAIEGFVIGGKGGDVAGEIAGMHYLVRYWLFQSGIPFLLITPSQVKKFVLGTGKGDKDLILKGVLTRFGHDVNTSDEADAITLAYTCRAFCGLYQPTINPQREVVKELQKSSRHLLEDKF